MSLRPSLFFGERISKGAELRVGSSAIIFNADRSKVLLTRRTDNGLWCLPGGAMESGEGIREACEREVFEETNLKVRVTRLIGIYSNRDMLVVYRGGNRKQFIVMHFEAEIVSGSLALSNETTDIGFFSPAEIDTMELHARHDIRIHDTLAFDGTCVIK